MLSSKKDGVFEETDKQTMLAKKTLEHLQVINIAEVILKEKFNGDSNSWVPALFEALRLKNMAYLREEKNVNDVVNSSLSNKFDDSFWIKENCNNVTTTGYQLISSCKKFMTGLNKNVDLFNLESLLPDLRDLEKNIHSYLSTIKQNDVRSGVEEKSVFEQTTSSKEKDIARKPDMSQLCSECNTKIVIFNNDIEFSYQLHCQEAIHKKASMKPISKAATEQTTKIFEKRRSEAELFTQEEKSALRRTLNERIKKHSNFIRIISRRDFHCTLCDCPISSLQNVESHVEGTKHTNTLNVRKPSDEILKVDRSEIPVAKLL